MANKLRKVRVLVALSIAGTWYEPDDVLELTPEHAKALAADYSADPAPEAVAYCERELERVAINPYQAETPPIAAEGESPPAEPAAEGGGPA